MPADAAHVEPGRRACLRCRPRAPRASTSPAKALSWSTMVLMCLLELKRSRHGTLTVIFFDKSPPAIAVATSAMLRTCAVRFDAIEVDAVGQVLPGAGDAEARWPGRRACPSVPTSRATRVTSPRKGVELVDHGVERFLPLAKVSPETFTVIFFERSPLAIAVAIVGDDAGPVPSSSRPMKLTRCR